MKSSALRRGDLVEVRSAAEILGTLDERGDLEGLRFMPEMLQFLGKRLLVSARAEKVCDTTHQCNSRRMPDSVILDDVRCDGSEHGGCQQSCRMFWKEAWLRRVSAADPAAPASPGEEAARQRLLALSQANTKRTVDVQGAPEERYTCQSTELLSATRQVKSLSPLPYLREYTCGNVSFARLLRTGSKAAVVEPLMRLKVMHDIFTPGPGLPFQEEALDLQPGDWVEVKSLAEITATLGPDQRCKGLWFDREMVPYCGGRFRVRSRVQRFIDEAWPNTGKLVVLRKFQFVTLEGVHCSGDRSPGRWFCPRAYYVFWRPAWLRRVEAPPA